MQRILKVGLYTGETATNVVLKYLMRLQLAVAVSKSIHSKSYRLHQFCLMAEHCDLK